MAEKKRKRMLMTILIGIWGFVCILLAGCGGGGDKADVGGKFGGEDKVKKALSEVECEQKLLPSTVFIITKNFLGYCNGTGIVLDSQGHILTNAHLVSTYAPILVKNPVTQDMDRATITGSSPCDDLAVIRVSENFEDYIPPAFGKGEALLPGDNLYTLGYSMNLNEGEFVTFHTFQQNTVYKTGVRYDYYGLDNTIQIDGADFKQEYSGGPLINQYGEVVGINTLGLFDPVTYSHTVPIETAQRIIPILMANSIKNIGVGVVRNNESLAEEQGNPYIEKSLVIISLEKGSPLYEVGWCRFDLLCEADGVELCNPGDLLQLIESRPSNTEITISGIGLFEDGLYRPYETTILIP